MKLVIAEKPSVAKAIAPVVGASIKKNGFIEGNGYIVSWCFGHLVGLYYPNDYCNKWAEKPWNFGMLPMLPDTWKFKVSNDCKNQFNILKELLNDSKIDEVICATDADREGECIFRYVYNLSGSRKPVKRLWVSSLEENAIIDGFKNLKPDKEYDNLYNAGFCRVKADWLVGMNGSRLFSIRHHVPLNIGRVQTPTLAVIVKRDYDVKNFVKQKYFTADLNLGGFTASSEKIDDENEANEFVSACNGKPADVWKVEKEVKTVNPPKLFDLTSLQREANKKFGYTAQQTLDYLQSLYEGKLATYPRTDSQYITDDMEQTAADVVRAVSNVFSFETVGEPNIGRTVNNKKVTGHHAILPTVNICMADTSSLPNGEKNILKIIALRLICAVSEPHKYESVKATICSVGAGIDFYSNSKLILQNGWKSVDEKIKAKDEEATSSQIDTKLLELTEGQAFENVTCEKSEHFTSPPKPYTEDTLLSAMEHAGQENYNEETEKKGIGTPATRAGIIEGLIKHGYAERKGKRITASEKGVQLINDVPNEVKSPKLTADWDMQLQQIERGERSAESFMQGITSFVKDICTKYGNTDDRVSFDVKPIGKCPKCGKDVKKGKFGFYCTGKCGMNVAKVYGKELTEVQLITLLQGSKTSFIRKGKKTVILPEVISKNYNDKTYYQWKTVLSSNYKKG